MDVEDTVYNARELLSVLPRPLSKRPRTSEEGSAFESRADPNSNAYAREGPLSDLRDELTALQPRMANPRCRYELMKKTIKHLLLSGTYVTSYARITAWREDLREVKTLIELIALVEAAVQSLSTMIDGKEDF